VKGRHIATIEVARLLGISRQRVGQLVAADPTFPRRVTYRHGGPVWYRAGIEAWAAEFRPGPLAEPNPMAGVILSVVRRARAESAGLGFQAIDAPMFWLGFWEPDLSGQVARVLESMGVTRDEIARTLKRRYRPQLRELPPTMSPRVQSLLETALHRAVDHQRAAPTEFDLAITLVEDEIRGISEARPQSETNWFGGRQGDSVLMALEDRGLDPVELRDRLGWIELSPASITTFAVLTLKPMRRRRRRERPRPPWLPELAKNPLGHDPWERRGWGSVFFLTPDGRQYTVDGYQWFFHVDDDGFPVRTLDGRPVGYRWQVDPPAKEKVRDFEALPMPPDPVGNWPDYERRRP
jgi:predicted DNA-binding transcriptional regulator AlpA